MIPEWSEKKYRLAYEAVRNVSWKFIGFHNFNKAQFRFRTRALEYYLHKGRRHYKSPYRRLRTIEAVSKLKGFQPMPDEIKYCVKCLQPLRTHPVMCDNQGCVRFGLLTFVYESEGIDNAESKEGRNS